MPVKRDSRSDLQAIISAMADELAQEKPSEAVLQACALFRADAERRAGEWQSFLNRINGTVQNDD